MMNFRRLLFFEEENFSRQSTTTMKSRSAIAFDICILFFCTIGLLVSLTILMLILSNRRQHPINASVVLLCNTYIAITFSCFNFIVMYGYSFYGELYENVNFDTWWCYAHAYLVNVGLCSIYQSYLLQSCYRFFRIVLHRYRQLQSLKFNIGLSLFQWLVSSLLMMVISVLPYIDYLPEFYHCQLSFSNAIGLLLAMSMIYFGPTACSLILYIYIIYYLKHAQQNRRHSNKRDLHVLRRIVILIFSILLLSFPTLILWLYYLATNYLYPLTYHLERFLFSLSLTILSVASAILSPHFYRLLKNLGRRHRQVHPAVVNPL